MKKLINLGVAGLGIALTNVVWAETVTIDYNSSPVSGNLYYPLSGGSDNTVNVDGYINTNAEIYGGYGSDVNGNMLFIKNGSNVNIAAAGVSATNGQAVNNSAIVEDSLVGFVYGGMGSGNATVSNNYIKLKNTFGTTYAAGSVGGSVSGTVIGNTLEMIGGSTWIIEGGTSGNIASGNTLILTNTENTWRAIGGLGSIVTDNKIIATNSKLVDVFGAELKYQRAGSKANNNDVELRGTTTLSGDLYGGIVTINSTVVTEYYDYDIVSENTLTIAPTTASITVAGNAANFSFIEFDFSDFPAGDLGPSAIYPTGGLAALVVGGEMKLFPGGVIANISVTGTHNAEGRLKLIEAGQNLDFRGTATSDIPGMDRYDFLSTTPYIDPNTPNILYVDYGMNWFFSNSDAHGTFTLNGEDTYNVGVVLDDRQGQNSSVSWDGNSLIKQGTGTLVLEANNTYNGGTQILGGTLQLGDGLDITAGDIEGDIAISAGATLSINRSTGSIATFDLDNLISGDGSVTQNGPNILTLSNALNSYSGGTNVNAGTLQIGDLDALGSGDVRNSTKVIFNNSVGDFQNNITAGRTALGEVSFTGSTVRLLAGLAASDIAIDGGSTVTLASDNPFIGKVVNNGVLEVDLASNRALNNAISGTGVVTQKGAGVLLMTGSNTYTGGTNIEAGTVAISNVTALGTGPVNNDATLQFWGASGDFANAILAPQTSPGDSLVSFSNGSNVRIMAALAADDVNVEAGSIATVAAGQTWTVANSVSSAGHLQLSAGSTIASDVDISGALSLVGSAVSTDITGNVANSGNLRLDGDGIGSHLRIGGNYVGNNGVLTLNTQLGGDNSPTDLLSITGVASGRTRVNVVNVGGLGDDTVKGIRVIETGGSAADTFYLQGGFVSAGAYDYSLQSLAEAGGVNWYLANSDINGGGPTYTPNLGSAIANTMATNQMFTMRYEDRAGAGQAQLAQAPEDNLWVRYAGNQNSFTSLNGQLHTKGTTSAVQVGIGLPGLLDSDSVDIGLMAGYGHYSGKTTSSRTDRKSTSRVNGYSVGVYGTWFSSPEHKDGLYVDSWLQWGKFNNHVRGADDNSYNYNSSGVMASVEVGANIEVGQFGSANVWLQPQAQVIYQGVRADTVKEHHGIDVKPGDDNVQLRTGIKTYTENVSLGDTNIVSRPFIEFNYIHNTEPYSSQIGSRTYRAAGGKDIGEVRLGLESRVANDHQLWFNYAYADGGKNYRDQSLHLGWKYDF